MARIRIYIGRHLCTAPRAVKEADALAAAGHEVSVHGLWFDPRLVTRDQALLASRLWTFSPYADARPGTAVRSLLWFRVRLSHRLARAAWRYLRLALPDAYGYGARELRTHALRQAVDLAIFHSEGGLQAAPALRRLGRRVGVDFEDWYSRDLPGHERRLRPIAALAALENEALLRDRYLLAPSTALATALAAASGGSTPEVVYNAFPLPKPASPTGTDSRSPDRVSLHWFSQTLGPGRGLETVFTTLPLLDFPWELHLRGDDPSGYFPRLLSGLPAPLRPLVHRHDTVPNHELPGRIACHDLGLATDGPVSPSRDLTITNKLFQYLQAGLAVVAGDTAGHREVLSLAPDAGLVYPASDPAALAAALAALCSDPANLARARSASARAHAEFFAHERQAHRYAALAARALTTR
jgi:glycosyltransferase involved in cell wall biosynthesis